MSKKNRLSEALKENFNMFGLAGAVALSAATLNPIPLLVGIVAEAAYLLFVPDSKWYEVRLSKRFDADVIARLRALRDQTFPGVSASMQQRYTRLESIRGDIGAQPGMEKEHWFREVVRKLDYLLEKFLQFAGKEAQFRTYLQNVYEEVVEDGRSGGKRANLSDSDTMPRGGTAPRRPKTAAPPPDVPTRLADRWTGETVTAIQTRYQADIEKVRALQGTEEDLNTRAILEKRADVLEQRHTYVGKIGKILTNLGYQMELLEDSFGLINDQLRARSPEQVLADIEGVVYQTDSMTKLLEELAPYEQMG